MDAIDTALANMKAAQDAHAKLLKWSHAAGRMVATCDERTLLVAYLETLKAERDYYAACGETDAVEQIGYQIEISERDLANLK